MLITLAKSAGFCFGVRRAVEIAEKNAGPNVYTLGPLIHNADEVERLKNLGVGVLDEPLKVKENDKVIIRSHGIGEDQENALRQGKAEIIDATCPFVKKIHNIAKSNYEQGRQIVIVGNENHPEVEGINGRCGNTAVIIEDEEDAKRIFPTLGNVCIVAQTTFNRILWKKIINIAKNTCNDAVVFDTICKATNERQRETLSLSQICDTMVVVGSHESSNTTKLYEICKANCKNVIHAENAAEIEKYKDKLSGHIGVTAGASAPARIIKEVLDKMSENMKEELTFEQQIEESFKTLNTGEIAKGTVIGVTPTEVHVNLNYKYDGVINIDDVTSDPNAKVEDIIHLGDEIEAYVFRISDIDGIVGLSIKRLEAIKGWEKVASALESGEILQATVTEILPKGVMAIANGTKVFIPASHASDRFLKDLSVLKGKTLPIKVIDVNRFRRRVVGSVKEALGEAKAKASAEFWEKIDAGQTEFDGRVKTLTAFGAFVDLGGIDGLIHVSELSWNHINHPSEVVSEDDAVKVTILEANKETGKVSLGYKKKEDDPWAKAKDVLAVGNIINATVVKLVPFGAFVEIMPGIDGLIHISQIANRKIAKPADVLEVGQEVRAKIMEINPETRKITLSMRVLIEEAPAEAAPTEETSQENTTEE